MLSPLLSKPSHSTCKAWWVHSRAYLIILRRMLRDLVLATASSRLTTCSSGRLVTCRDRPLPLQIKISPSLIRVPKFRVLRLMLGLLFSRQNSCLCKILKVVFISPKVHFKAGKFSCLRSPIFLSWTSSKLLSYFNRLSALSSGNVFLNRRLKFLVNHRLKMRLSVKSTAHLVRVINWTMT